MTSSHIYSLKVSTGDTSGWYIIELELVLCQPFTHSILSTSFRATKAQLQIYLYLQYLDSWLYVLSLLGMLADWFHCHTSHNIVFDNYCFKYIQMDHKTILFKFCFEIIQIEAVNTFKVIFYNIVQG